MPSNKRILFVITDLQVGGVPLHLLRLARFLKKQNWHIDVVSLSAGGHVGELLAAREISIHHCDAKHAFDWRVFERLAQLIESLQPDLVHSLLFHANLASRIACLLSGFPRQRLICEIQTVEIERCWHLWVDRITHRLCRAVVCNSESVRTHLHKSAGIPIDRLTVIEGGVDVESIVNAQPLSADPWRTAENEPLLLWVGRMDPIKGLDTLVDAVAKLATHRVVKLLLLGDGPERTRIESMVVDKSLQENVFFLGMRNDVDRLIKTADLFVFPSRTEGMPNALLEAMAGRLPIVATDVPGCHDLVADGKTGRLVSVDDSQALADAIEFAFVETDKTKEMSANAWHYVSDHHSATRCHHSYADLYRQTLDCLSSHLLSLQR
ncbi:MAG: glycosyl transferase family 1 [Phycisphaerae bacterium]|nr:MAG: glycosyl transferase family 1 [Phycisphaerae bacterium]